MCTVAEGRVRDGLVDVVRQALPDERGPRAALAEGSAVFAFFDLEALQDDLPEAIALVDAAESARAARQRNPAHRDALLLAYALHRQVLAQLLDCPPARVGLGRDAKGCPRLPGDAVRTSLSHAGGRVAIAVCAAGPVGIDLEPDVRAGDMPELASHVAHPHERIALRALPPHARGHALLRLWVRKEALLKAAGIGLEVDMHRFVAPEDVPLPLPGEGVARGAVAIRMLDAGPGWTSALAAPPGARVSGP